MAAGEFRTPYSGYDVLEKRDTPSWNKLTRTVVEARLRQVPSRRFFTGEEWIVLEALCDRLVPQPDRLSGPVPIAPWIDDRLAKGKRNGFRYEEMPPDDEAWRQGLSALEQESELMFDQPFASLTPCKQDEVLDRLRCGEVAAPSWENMSPSRFFNGALSEAVGFYYAHPAAWSEIGFGGPASPRGYVRLDMNESDPWEAQEKREFRSEDD